MNITSYLYISYFPKMQLSKLRFYGGYPQFYNINLSIFNYDDLALGGLTYIPWIKMVKMYLYS